ncbi:MAG TPA: metal-dependent hydrolase [Burkholderiales bacterium]|nr:metal-dependent hydrolase [Burkholderiales bacterium]
MLHRSALWLRSSLLAVALTSLTAGFAQAQTKVHWYGQAAFRIETPSGGVILIDPWLKVPTNPDKESIAKLARVDYILITHGHWDHIGDAIEIGKKTGAIVVAPYGLQYNLKSVLGYPEAQATLATGGNVGGTIDLPKAGAKVTFTNAVHGSELVPPMVQPSAPGQPAAIASGNPVGYVLQIDRGPTIYHTGDTDVFTDMKLIAEFYKVDLMLANIGGHFAMNPDRAALAVEWVSPRQVVPMHFGTYPILAGNPAQFKAALEKRGLGGRMVEMKPGEERTF